MAEYLHEELSRFDGYVKKSGKPRTGLVPLALTRDCEVVWGLERILLSSLQSKHLMDYDDEVERQRRLVCDSALGLLARLHPKYVEPAVRLVGRAVKSFWTNLKMKASDEEILKIVSESGNRIYGATSYGRRDPNTDISTTPSSAQVGEVVAAKARIDLWFSELDKTPLDVPRLMSLYDFFYCKVFLIIKDGTQTPEYRRAEIKKSTWRPDWYEKQDPRGRLPAANQDKVTATSLPGLLSESFTIPNPKAALMRCGVAEGELKLQDRKRGWDLFKINAKPMNPEFREHLAKNNLPFSASASGTTSTLFLAAEAFANISSFQIEEQRQYLLACVIYLVSGGMHTCDEIFYTGKAIGLLTEPHQYLDGLPASFKGSLQCEKWQTEFWDIVRPEFKTVRGAPHRQMKTKPVAK